MCDRTGGDKVRAGSGGKLRVLALIAVTAVGVVACGGSNSSGGSSTPTIGVVLT